MTIDKLDMDVALLVKYKSIIEQMANFLLPKAEFIIKSNHGQYLYVNQYFQKAAETIGLIPRGGSLVGKYDYDFYAPEVINQFRTNEDQVRIKMTNLNFTENVVLDNGRGKLVFHSKKGPVFDNNQEVKGIICRCQETTLIQTKFGQVKLSPREIQILAATFHGLSAKGISEYMQLSTRTIEGYLNNLKCKLNLDSKKDLPNFVLSERLDVVMRYFFNPYSV